MKMVIYFVECETQRIREKCSMTISGKGENIWDTFSHTTGTIIDQSSGDVACDSYRKYQVDVQLIRNLGVRILQAIVTVHLDFFVSLQADFYRFSISWSRVLPTGSISGGINEAGIQYYNNVINELLANGIEPFVTIYHWDLPQPLEDVGGWLNDTIVDEFEAYADLLYSRFGDRVKKWITLNEPWVVCVMGYGDGVYAPGIRQAATAPYICSHNSIKAHAKAYRLYESKYKNDQEGVCGITLDSGFYEPNDPNNVTHVEAAERAQQFRVCSHSCLVKNSSLSKRTIFFSMDGTDSPSSKVKEIIRKS